MEQILEILNLIMEILGFFSLSIRMFRYMLMLSPFVILIYLLILIYGLFHRGENIILCNPMNNSVKHLKTGFSVEVFLFGAFVPLFSGFIYGFIILFFVNLFLLPISNVVFAFVYNKMYIKYLKDRLGYINW